MHHFKLQANTVNDKHLLSISNKNRVEDKRLAQKLAGFDKNEKLLKREIEKIREARLSLKHDIAQFQRRPEIHCLQPNNRENREIMRRRSSTGNCGLTSAGNKSLPEIRGASELPKTEMTETISSLQSVKRPSVRLVERRRGSMPAIPAYHSDSLPVLQQRHIIDVKTPNSRPAVAFDNSKSTDDKEKAAIHNIQRDALLRQLAAEEDEKRRFAVCARSGRRASAPVVLAAPPTNRVKYSHKGTQDFIKEEKLKSQFRRVGQAAVGAAILMRYRRQSHPK